MKIAANLQKNRMATGAAFWTMTDDSGRNVARGGVSKSGDLRVDWIRQGLGISTATILDALDTAGIPVNR